MIRDAEMIFYVTNSSLILENLKVAFEFTYSSCGVVREVLQKLKRKCMGTFSAPIMMPKSGSQLKDSK